MKARRAPRKFKRVSPWMCDGPKGKPVSDDPDGDVLLFDSRGLGKYADGKPCHLGLGDMATVVENGNWREIAVVGAASK